MRGACCSASGISVARDRLLKGDASRAEAIAIDRSIDVIAVNEHVAGSRATALC